MNETTQSAAFLREIGARFDDREAYAAALASVAELTRDRDAAIVALGEWARKAGALETRVAELSAAADAMIEYGLGYDQSGNGRHGTQTTPANQPQIVANGAIITEDRNPRGT